MLRIEVTSDSTVSVWHTSILQNSEWTPAAWQYRLCQWIGRICQVRMGEQKINCALWCQCKPWRDCMHVNTWNTYPRLVCYPQIILTNLSSYDCSYAIVIWLILGSRLAVATLVNTNESSPGSAARSRRSRARMSLRNQGSLVTSILYWKAGLKLAWLTFTHKSYSETHTAWSDGRTI